MSEATDTPPVDENKLIAERREKLKALRGQGIAYPNDFRREDFAGSLQEEFADAEQWTAETLEGNGRQVKMAGRLMAKRVMGKASFAQIQDESGRIQLFLQSVTLGERYDASPRFPVDSLALLRTLGLHRRYAPTTSGGEAFATPALKALAEDSLQGLARRGVVRENFVRALLSERLAEHPEPAQLRRVVAAIDERDPHRIARQRTRGPEAGKTTADDDDVGNAIGTGHGIDVRGVGRL